MGGVTTGTFVGAIGTGRNESGISGIRFADPLPIVVTCDNGGIVMLHLACDLHSAPYAGHAGGAGAPASGRAGAGYRPSPAHSRRSTRSLGRLPTGLGLNAAATAFGS